MNNNFSKPLLSIENIVVKYPSSKGTFFRKNKNTFNAVDDVSLDVYPGESVGLVGESGCGKTTLSRTAVKLIQPTSGKIFFDGIDIASKKEKEIKHLRRYFQIIFQDPYASLNPKMTLFSILSEPLKEFGLTDKKNMLSEISALLETVGLSPKSIKKYPHEFSGGQRQRIAIARALACKPKLLIADEPVSALDVSVQAQIINLLSDLQTQMNLSILFVSHNLAVVKHICSRVIVMKDGKIVESNSTEEIFNNPSSNYTKTLISSIPIPDPAFRFKSEKNKI